MEAQPLGSWLTLEMTTTGRDSVWNTQLRPQNYGAGTGTGSWTSLWDRVLD